MPPAPRVLASAPSLLPSLPARPFVFVAHAPGGMRPCLKLRRRRASAAASSAPSGSPCSLDSPSLLASI
eukprot:scaffold150792_cov35-Tisochrysis_lutea.AAC.1